MFPFLRLGGTWRPFFDRDRVLLWLDAESVVPRSGCVVYPSREPGAARVGAPVRPGVESPDAPILDVRMVSVSDRRARPIAFRIPGAPPRPAPRWTELAGPARLSCRRHPSTPATSSSISIALPPRPRR